MRYTYIIKHVKRSYIESPAIYRQEEIIARKNTADKARKFLLRFGIQTQHRLHREVVFVIPNTGEHIIQINRIPQP